MDRFGVVLEPGSRLLSITPGPGSVIIGTFNKPCSAYRTVGAFEACF